MRHYRRRLGSEKTKENLLNFLKGLCVFSGRNPDELAALSVSEASHVVQTYLDSLADKGRSIRYINVASAYIKTFFKVNEFENGNELRVERYFQPSRYRKRPEYVPTSEEIERMAYASGSKRNRAVILMLYTSGLRVSTLQALTYGDIKEELEKGFDVIKIPVYPEMKRRIPEACKGGIPLLHLHQQFIPLEYPQRAVLASIEAGIENVAVIESLDCKNARISMLYFSAVR